MMTKHDLTENERMVLIKLIEHEQVKYMIANEKYDTDEYKSLEALKAKIRDM